MPEQEEINKMHRWFAIEANNKGWGLTGKQDRSAEESEEMLHLAFVASHHWRQIGEPINGARADMLLAHACAHLRLAGLALKFAERCHAFCLGNECADWDKAFAEAELAYAFAVDGQHERAAEHLKQATEKGALLSDPEDKKVFDAELLLIQEQVSRLAQ